MKRITEEKKIEFLRKYKELAGNAFKMDSEVDSAANKTLVNIARDTLGYSDKTYWGDISSTLRRVYRKLYG